MFIWNVSPIAFSVFGIQVYWYGVIYAISLASAWGAAAWSLRKVRNVVPSMVPSANTFDNFMFFSIVWMVIGARLGHVLFYDFEYYLENPLEIFMLRQGGLAFHGSVIALAIYTYSFCRTHNFEWRVLTDVLCFAGSLGLGIGRIANFVNQELYGRICTADFAVIFSSVDNMPRYPTQLFESVFEGFLNFWILLVIFRMKGVMTIGSGVLTSIFCIIYSSSRFIIEFYKEVATEQYFGWLSLTVGQTLSIALFLFGIFVINCWKSRSEHNN
ncbi:MAG: prolipoprotein diacylglyceryl transferase [Holosporales bacterium]|jgi:phosphatidylglycerol:prolipoprotein diacylglycerol transferase|nr:prolipoprotein diacylglyceryl transferase [Holosporales bacterium]